VADKKEKEKKAHCVAEQRGRRKPQQLPWQQLELQIKPCTDSELFSSLLFSSLPRRQNRKMN
jgi:hypothetical protein